MTDDLILLRDALYGTGGPGAPRGLHPDVRISEVREKIGPVLRRRPWRRGRSYEFVRQVDFDRAWSRISRQVTQ